MGHALPNDDIEEDTRSENIRTAEEAEGLIAREQERELLEENDASEEPRIEGDLPHEDNIDSSSVIRDRVQPGMGEGVYIDYDLDDLIQDVARVPEEFAMIELEESDEDRALYLGRASTMSVEADEEGWHVSYAIDDNLVMEFDTPSVKGAELPVYAEVLAKASDRKETNYRFHFQPDEEEELSATLEQLGYVEEFLAENTYFPEAQKQLIFRADE